LSSSFLARARPRARERVNRVRDTRVESATRVARVESALRVAGRSNIEPTRSRVDAREANVPGAPARAEKRAMIVGIVGIVGIVDDA